MPNRRLVAKHLGELMRILSHPDRIQIVQLLAVGGEHSVGDIAENLDVTPTRISQHLSTLRAYRLVNERTDGRHRFYSLTIKELAFWLVDGVDFVADRFDGVSKEQGADAKKLWLDTFG